MDRCALFVDAGYALADGAMAVHGTRRRDSVSWDHAGLLKLLAGLARDRTGLPVLRCYWYETADGGRTAEHDALAEMPGLKLRLVNTRPGRREGMESQLRRDVVTLAKSGAIADAFIASADEHLAEIVAEVQDLGLRVVVLHIASDGGWTIPQGLRQECDDIVEISGVHLRPFVDLIRGAEPAAPGEQYAVASAAISRAGGPAQALPAGAYRPAAGSEYGAAQPYANGGQVNSAGTAPGSRADGSPQADNQAGYQQAGYQRAGSYEQRAGTGPDGSQGPAAGQGQADAGAAGIGTPRSSAPGQGASGEREFHDGQHEAHGGTGQHAAPGGSGQFPAQPPGTYQYDEAAAHEPGAAHFTGAAHGTGAQQRAGAPHYAGQPQHAGADHGSNPQYALPGQGMHAAHGAGAPQGSAAHALGGPAQASAVGGSTRDEAPGAAAGPNHASSGQPAGAGTGYPDSAATGMQAQGGYQNGIMQGPGQPGLERVGIPQNGSAQNGAAQNGHHVTGQSVGGQSVGGQGGSGQGGARSGGYPDAQGASGPEQQAPSVHHLSGLSFPPGSAVSAQNGYPGSQSRNGADGYHDGTGVHAAPGYQNGSAQNGSALYSSFNGFQAGGIQNGGPVNSPANQPNGGPGGGRAGMNPAGFEAAPVPAQQPPYGPVNPAYFGGQQAPAEQAGTYGSPGQPSMPGNHAGSQAGPSFQQRQPHQAQPPPAQPPQVQPQHAQPPPAQPPPAQPYSSQPPHGQPTPPAVRPAQPVAVSLPEAVKAAHSEGYVFGESVGREAPGLWLEAVLARKPRMPSDLEARLLQGSVLPIDSLLHDEVRHSLRRGFWDALESARR